MLPESFFLFEASIVSIFYLVNNDQLHITVAMLPLTKMFSHLTNAVPELAAMAVMALTHLSPASPNILFSTVRDLTLDQVDNPGTAAVQIEPDVIGSAAVPAGESGGGFYNRAGDASPSITFVTSLVTRWRVVSRKGELPESGLDQQESQVRWLAEDDTGFSRENLSVLF